MALMKRDQSIRDAALRLDKNRIALARAVFEEMDRGRKLDGGCDDIDMPSEFTDEDTHALVVDYHTWNGDPEEAQRFDSIGFSCAFAYLTAALLKHATETIRALGADASPKPCGCYDCASQHDRMTTMIVCATCGHKRCPKAMHHKNDCTGSNEPGQSGSRY